MGHRVLHFHFGKEGGAERFFVNLSRAFAKRGIEQKFFIRPNRTWEAQIAELGPVIRNNFSRLSPYSLLARVKLKSLYENGNHMLLWLGCQEQDACYTGGQTRSS